MGSVGDAYDNAMCESFFATLECALIDRYRLRIPAESETAVFEFIEGWYNSRRRHSALDMMSPIEYEASHLGVTQDTSPDLSTETGELQDHHTGPVISSLTVRKKQEKMPPEYLEKERHNFWNPQVPMALFLDPHTRKPETPELLLRRDYQLWLRINISPTTRAPIERASH